jgi:hypothetical protein
VVGAGSLEDGGGELVSVVVGVDVVVVGAGAGSLVVVVVVGVDVFDVLVEPLAPSDIHQPPLSDIQ